MVLRDDTLQSVAVRKLEAEVRMSLARALLVMTVLCLFLEVSVGFVIYYSGEMNQGVMSYALLRVILPTSINIILCFMAHVSARTPNYSDKTKNRFASLAIIIFAGQLSIVHSYYVPIWGVSLFALMFCSLFHDPVIHKIEGAVCLAFIAAAALQHNLKYPEQFNYTVECLIVTEVTGIGICYLAFLLEKHSRKEFLINMEITAGASKYKTGYEVDALTGVYSRAFLTESAQIILENASELAPVGVAMLDIDDFKQVNDNFGHDNGDIVLRQFGELLNLYSEKNIVCGRFGGEEFVIVFAHGEEKLNIAALEEIRIMFETMTFAFMSGNITVSGGYKLVEEPLLFDDAVKLADEAMYDSKRGGKNKITVNGGVT